MSLDTLIAKVEQRLDDLEVKPSSPDALRTLLSRLDAKIREAQEKGYSPKEIVDIVLDCGFAVKRDEFEKQLVEALGTKRKKSTIKRSKTHAKKTPSPTPA